MSVNQGLANWHRVMSTGTDPAELAAIVAEDAVFHSPVVHTPQAGCDKVVAYLSAAGQVLGKPGGHADFRYVRELVDGHEACLEFTATIDGIHINGIDLIAFDRDWMIRDFKVMVRPLKAINKLWELMAAQLQA
ncbi:MAG TPA: nuclear transport factor 2 family protein [Novosphingobium sp.]|nr:nuclear transport factor 2 family protein [Novosphingobium sp.]